MKHLSTIFIFCIFITAINAQNNPIVSGPLLTQVELRTARLWVEVKPTTSSASIKYWKKENPATKWIKAIPAEITNKDFKPLQLEIGGLEPNTTYEYIVLVNHTATTAKGFFTTKELWQWRKPPPDFNFLAGSCAYFNDPEFDRLGKPYGGDSSIFDFMAKEKAAFMLWLGDNWYTREVDYNSEWGLWYRASKDRQTPSLQPFLKAMPQYAIWDDHDYGPNDANKSYILKEASRKVFMNYWGNPSYGQKQEGIYTSITHADCDFFLMDDRWFRSADDMPAFVDGQPNTAKRMWGEAQLEWLKNTLLHSKATFKFIVTGSQTLNPASSFDCLQDFPIEFNDLMNFLMEAKINGVLFLTGDRHHSEVVKYERPNGYTLYDITTSPLTAGIGVVSGKEKNNPDRIPNTLVESYNYARMSVSGKPKERKLTVNFVGIKGETLASWSIAEADLKMPISSSNKK
jgi:alkaline phosphatase D